MSIQNRLKKLENKKVIQGFCKCFSGRFKAIADSVYDNIPYKAKDYPVPIGDYCHKCKMPVNIELERNFEKNLIKVWGYKC